MPQQSIRHRLPRIFIFAAALCFAMTGTANAGDLALTHARIYPAPNAAAIADTTEEYRQLARALDWRQILLSL